MKVTIEVPKEVVEQVVAHFKEREEELGIKPFQRESVAKAVIQQYIEDRAFLSAGDAIHEDVASFLEDNEDNLADVIEEVLEG